MIVMMSSGSGDGQGRWVGVRERNMQHFSNSCHFGSSKFVSGSLDDLLSGNASNVVLELETTGESRLLLFGGAAVDSDK